MPYYRIVIWTKRRTKPFSGIKLMGDDNINKVFNEYHSKAVREYGNDLKDVEVQMLSKLCKAVQEFEKKLKP